MKTINLIGYVLSWLYWRCISFICYIRFERQSLWVKCFIRYDTIRYGRFTCAQTL